LRKPIIAGNWKMNNTISSGKELILGIIKGIENKTVEAVICVPFTNLESSVDLTKDTEVKVGAQNMHWLDNGAYTGEISPLMLKELNVDYVIIGHSERRQYFNETDETVNLKVKSALSNNINPIVCVGETLQQREEKIHIELVQNQVRKAFEGIENNEVSKVVIAYEPIWAIGTGVTASSEQAEEMCKLIRDTIKSIYNENISDEIRIQYGGSVKPDNIKELMNKENIDGALVGGASLKAEDFLKLLNF